MHSLLEAFFCSFFQIANLLILFFSFLSFPPLFVSFFIPWARFCSTLPHAKSGLEILKKKPLANGFAPKCMHGLLIRLLFSSECKYTKIRQQKVIGPFLLTVIFPSEGSFVWPSVLLFLWIHIPYPTPSTTPLSHQYAFIPDLRLSTTVQVQLLFSASYSQFLFQLLIPMFLEDSLTESIR